MKNNQIIRSLRAEDRNIFKALNMRYGFNFESKFHVLKLDAPITINKVWKAANEKGYLAGNIVKQVAQALGGSGGGRPDMASGAGRDASKVGTAIELVKGMVK